MAVIFADLDGEGFTITKKLFIGPRTADVTDVADLIQGEPGMGLITGGALSINSGLIVDVGAGFGYLMKSPFPIDPPGHVISRVDWVDQTFTVDDDTTNYVFWDLLGVLSKSATQPSIVSSILLGIVYTENGNILWIDTRKVIAHHSTNLDDRYVREVFGPLFAGAGSVTTNPSSDFLAVTAGTYYHSSSRFTPSGFDTSSLIDSDTLQAGSTAITAVLKAGSSAVDDFFE